MPMNMIQCQRGLCLTEFLQQFGTEAKYRAALYRWRSPSGFRCPECGGQHRSSFRRGRQIVYQCRACQHQTTLIGGTLLASTKLPLKTWLLAIYLLTSTKDQPRRAGAYAPPWRLLSHRLADEAQNHACHGGAGKIEETQGLRTD